MKSSRSRVMMTFQLPVLLHLSTQRSDPQYPRVCLCAGEPLLPSSKKLSVLSGSDCQKSPQLSPPLGSSPPPEAQRDPCGRGCSRDPGSKGSVSGCSVTPGYQRLGLEVPPRALKETPAVLASSFCWTGELIVVPALKTPLVEQGKDVSCQVGLQILNLGFCLIWTLQKPDFCLILSGSHCAVMMNHKLAFWCHEVISG